MPSIAPFAYGIIQAAITTARCHRDRRMPVDGSQLRFLEQWAPAWLTVFLTMLAVVIFIAPLIQRVSLP